MSAAPDKSPSFVQHTASWMTSGKGLYHKNAQWRMAVEAGIMGLGLMVVLAIFTPSGRQSVPQSTYTPPSSPGSQTQATPQVSNQAAQPPPQISAQDLQRIRAQTGTNVVPLGDVAPVKVTPVFKPEEASSPQPTQNEFGTFRGKTGALAPVYVEADSASTPEKAPAK